MINIDKIKETFGIVLVLIRHTEIQRILIGEVIKDDDISLTVRNPGVLIDKPQFNQIVQPDGTIHPLITIPEGYSDCEYDIIGIQPIDLQLVKSDSIHIIEVQDISIVNLYKKLIGR